MSIKDKMNEAKKLTERKERQMANKLKDAYTQAYKEIKKEMKDNIIEYGEDAKWSQEQLQKYGRKQKLLDNIQKELKKAESIQDYQMKTYLKDAYEINYLHTGYALETESLVKLNYSVLDRKQVDAAINNDLLRVAIDDNKRATRNKIRRALTQSVVQGEGIQASAKRMKDSVNYGLNRATKIARTETTKVMADARKESFDHAARNGVEVKKQWVATLDGRTRDTHASVDGQIVEKDEKFEVNGTQMDRPGDTSAPAKEVVNCRCTMIGVIPEIDYDQRRITKTNELSEYKTFDEWRKDRVGGS